MGEGYVCHGVRGFDCAKCESPDTSPEGTFVPGRLLVVIEGYRVSRSSGRSRGCVGRPVGGGSESGDGDRRPSEDLFGSRGVRS